MKSGLLRINPHRKDWSLLHTFGALEAPTGLPDNFSLYNGQIIPNQEQNDTRFPFLIPPLPEGCTGESGAFETGLQDGVIYNPQDLYLATPPGDPYSGRDMRDMLNTLINRGVKDANGNLSPKRVAYFNCYGSGAIDDTDAVRIALFINQWEKRGVYIGSQWCWGDAPPAAFLYAPTLSAGNPLHCYIATGWMTFGGDVYLEIIPWLGMASGEQGRFYVKREYYNQLMATPYSGAFTITKVLGVSPVPIGVQAYVDHLVYYIRSLFHV